MNVQLRPYQKDIIRSVLADWRAGLTDTLVVAATGAGKTIVFCALIDLMLSGNHDKRALILAHRQELITQPVERLLKFWPDWQGRVGVVMAEHDQADAQIIVASVQTLSVPGRLDRILAHGPINLLIVDEAHHVYAGGYREVIARLREANPVMRHLGVTATPVRSDGGALREVYQKTSAIWDIKKLVPEYLVPPRWLAISTGISLKGVRSRDGDFQQKKLAEVFETDNCFDLVVASHKKFAPGRRGIAFVVSVEGAYRLAEAFNEAGIRAAAADGNTPKEVRTGILKQFRAGQLDMLVNCQLFTEGLDIPEIDVIHMVRPTKSDGLYLQCIGRGLRPVPGKEDCLILDYAPAEARQIVYMGDVLGMPKNVKELAVDAEKAETTAGEVVGGFTFDGELRGLEGDPLELVARELNYLELSPFNWHRHSDGLLTLELGPDAEEIGRTLVITPPVGDDDARSLILISRPKKGRAYTELLLQSEDFQALSDVANDYAEQHGNAVLAMKNRRWQNQPISEGQTNWLMRLAKGDLSPDRIRKLRRGEAAQLITYYTARQALRRSGWWKAS